MCRRPLGGQDRPLAGPTRVSAGPTSSSQHGRSAAAGRDARRRPTCPGAARVAPPADRPWPAGSNRLAVDLLCARADLYAKGLPATAYLRDHGLDWSAIAAEAGLLLLARVRFEPPRQFEFGGRVLAAVIEALDEGGAVRDLVAWPVSRPDKAASLFGRAGMVGERALFDPATFLFDAPLVVHRTPLDWLRAGGRGCAVVDPGRAGRLLLDVPGRIAAQDDAHGAELAALIEASLRLDRIVVPVGEGA